MTVTDSATGKRRTEVEAIMARVKYRDWEFRTVQYGESLMMVADFRDDRGTRTSTRKWYISPFATKSEIVQTMLKLVLTAVEHEAREDFKYDHVAVFGPHHDVDQMKDIVLDIRAEA